MSILPQTFSKYVSTTDTMLCQPAIASMSLGRAWHHDLHKKLIEASKAGFKGVEMFYEDLEYLAKSKSQGDTSSKTLLQAAQQLRDWCDELKLVVIALQPFLFYEGLLDREEHAKRTEELEGWMDIAQILGTDVVQIPSNFLPRDQITGEMDVIVQDMLEIADLGAKRSPLIRFAYENLAWGTYVDTWEKCWEVVKRVNRENFGMCLDTFNICGRVWADPASPTGKTKNADEELERSMLRLQETVDVTKVFFVQIVDAERLDAPLVEGHPWYQANQPARMSWSRNARLFTYEEGGYLPIEKVMDALFKGLGYQGWVSLELFSRTLAEKDGDVPRAHAVRGMQSWEKVKERYGL